MVYEDHTHANKIIPTFYLLFAGLLVYFHSLRKEVGVWDHHAAFMHACTRASHPPHSTSTFQPAIWLTVMQLQATPMSHFMVCSISYNL
jgi:hypothetical protein